MSKLVLIASELKPLYDKSKLRRYFIQTDCKVQFVSDIWAYFTSLPIGSEAPNLVIDSKQGLEELESIYGGVRNVPN